MTRNVIVPSKTLAEIISVPFPFGDQLEFGETISGAVVTCKIDQGFDETPEGMIFGSPTISGVVVTQQIDQGLAGNVYFLVCTISTSLGHVLTKGARLAIVDSPRAFQGP